MYPLEMHRPRLIESNQMEEFISKRNSYTMFYFIHLTSLGKEMNARLAEYFISFSQQVLINSVTQEDEC